MFLKREKKKEGKKRVEKKEGEEKRKKEGRGTEDKRILWNISRNEYKEYNQLGTNHSCFHKLFCCLAKVTE